jgi:ABC-type iron transport system FetAB permease component
MVNIKVLRIAMTVTVVSLVTGAIARVGLTSPAAAQSIVLTEAQSNAMNSYNAAVSRFKSVLQQRRTQIDSKQPLANLPGQALYLARNDMLITYKDLTDVLPSKIGRLNKFKIPSA